MKLSEFATVLLATSSVVFAVWSAPATAQRKATRQYVVKPGDTCVKIARRELGDRRKYRVIHKYNDLGKPPHKLEPGSTLELPVVDAESDATLTSKVGAVRVREPARPKWDPAKEGMGLYREWRVNSRARAAAELTFRDESKLQMRANTVVIIYGATTRGSRRATARAELEKGTLRARLSELSGRRMVVETPSSEATLGTGSALVAVDSSGTSRVANHAGKAVALRSRRGKRRRRGKSVAVKAGYGSKVERGKEPSKPRPLPPAPAWQASELRALGLAGVGATAVGEWQAVAEAARYRVEIGSDAAMQNLLASVTVDAAVTRFEAHRLPGGKYFARVAAIDGEGFEGAPSSVATLEVYELALSGPAAPSTPAGATPAEGLDVESPPQVDEVAFGTVVTAPDGATCAAGDGQPSREFALRTAGSVSVTCDVTGGDRVALVIPVAAAPGQPALTVVSELGSARPLPRGAPTVVDIEVRDYAGSLDDVVVESSAPSVSVQIIERAPDRLRVEVEPTMDAPATVELSVATGGGEALASTSLAIEAPPAPAPAVTQAAPRPASTWRKWVGFFGAGTYWPMDHNLGNAGPDEFQVRAGGGGGMRFGAGRGRLWAEGEALAAQLFYEDSDNGWATAIAARLQGGFDLVSSDSRALFAVAGAGIYTLSQADGLAEDDLDWAAHWGLGASVQVARGVGLRCDARHVLSPGKESGVASSVEALLGIEFSWGAARQ